MVRDRNNQKQLWSDMEFVNILEKVKAERTLNGNPVNNLGQLTKEILECPSFEQVLKELKDQKANIGFTIKMDKKRLW